MRMTFAAWWKARKISCLTPCDPCAWGILSHPRYRILLCAGKTAKGFAEAYVKRTEAARESKSHSSKHTCSSQEGREEALVLGLMAVEGINSRPSGIIPVRFGEGNHWSLQHPNCLGRCQWCKFHLSPSTLNCTQGLCHVEGQLSLDENADHRFHSMILTQAGSL